MSQGESRWPHFGIQRLLDSQKESGFHVMQICLSKHSLYGTAIILAFLCLTSLAHARLSYVKVQAEGRGATLNDAISDGLIQAIGQVNGKSIESEKAQQSIRSLKSGPDGTAASFSKDQSSKIFEKTRGVIKEYKVLDQKELDGGRWKVSVGVVVAKYKQTSGTKRLRIAVFPFQIAGFERGKESVSDKGEKLLKAGMDHLLSASGEAVPDQGQNAESLAKRFALPDGPGDPERMERLLNQGIVTYLTQTRKFTVLDRQYISEALGETNLIMSGNVPIEETAKLGQQLTADYILVGTLEKLSARRVEKKMRTSDRVIVSTSGDVEFSYRIIDVASRMIKFADLFDAQVNGGPLAKSNSPDTALTKMVSQSVGETILYAIYPLLIEKVTGKTVTIGQGGKGINSGDTYELFLRGDKIVDSYTKESLGYDERKIGVVEITSVRSKTSTGKIVEAEEDVAAVFKPKKLVLRPLKKSQQQQAPSVKEVRKEIEKKRQERDKKYEDDG